MSIPTPVSAQEFRRALGHFGSGVTVVTSPAGDSFHGMTASAFISVSLEPPLVLVSVDKRAHMHAVLHNVSHYGISILASDQAAVSNHFAGRPLEQVPALEEVQGVPLVAGALARLVCRIRDRHDAGDHTLFVGLVEYADTSEKAPLMYYAGKYGDFSPK
ncbi:flavin reductase (DIM6/NTAB) family NADH-FMN oxidoreductase RutF [Deinobacterium chartae]|uniref:Flavin reductase (DIM6/NTAB) family NADH-FMN oxidoreductase RutF n=1 Tax=Deinobacterium chartae TaxID=521158 RepID=A0A841HZ30_9DEIO|nr:flavin reductase family protein [Deinobacterium chartae]MBB6098791.1 flavin reductase (DIM6/NTAB) family NADH-FMN oxidoreductase RutF [Deinobacterium chartae]